MLQHSIVLTVQHSQYNTTKPQLVQAILIHPGGSLFSIGGTSPRVELSGLRGGKLTDSTPNPN